VRVNSQIRHRCAEGVQNEAWGGLAVTEIVRTVVRDNLDKVAAHFELGLGGSGRVQSHAERHEVEHCLVFQDRCCLEDRLVVELRAVKEHFKNDMPGLVRFRELNQFLVCEAEDVSVEGSSILSLARVTSCRHI